MLDTSTVDSRIDNKPNLRVRSPNQMRNQPVVATMGGVGDETEIVEGATVGDFGLQSISRDDAAENLAKASVTSELWEGVVKRGISPNDSRAFLIDGNGL